MPLSQDCRDFVDRWMRKANDAPVNDLGDYFDKFITLFIVFNRLYAEATFELWRNQQYEPDNDEYLKDVTAATSNLTKFLGAAYIVHELESDTSSSEAMASLKKVIRRKNFYVLLRGPFAEGNRDRDENLLSRLNSTKKDEKAVAILEFIYAVRCNTLHGSKEYDRTQQDVLAPCIVLVSHLIKLLRAKLDPS